MAPFLAVILAASACSSTTAEAIPTAELCNALVAQYKAIDGLKLQFKVEQHWNSGSPNPPDEKSLTPATFVAHLDVESIRAGERYRIEDNILSRTVDDDGKEEFDKVHRITTWDGVTSRVRRGDPGKPDDATFIISQDHPTDAWAQFYVTWQGWWIVQCEEHIGFIELLHASDLQGPELVADGRTKWRTASSPIGKAHEIVVFARRVADAVELDEVQLRVYREGAVTGNDADLSTMTVFKFGPSAREKDVPLASSCVATCSFWMGGAAEKDFWGYVRIDLIDAAPATIDADTFRQAPTAKGTVIDERYRIAYDQGSNYINVDGRILKTAEPVAGDSVGHNLESWVDAGTWVDALDPISGKPMKPLPPSTRPQNDRR